MRREGRLSGKPSNKSSRKTGSRGGGITTSREEVLQRCCCFSSSSSHKHSNNNNITFIPVSKKSERSSSSKAKGSRKRSACDVTINHLLEDWRVCTPPPSCSSSFPAAAPAPPRSRRSRKSAPASQSVWDSDTDPSSGEVCDPCESNEDAGKLLQEEQEEEKEVSAMAIMIDTAIQNMRNKKKRKPAAAACVFTVNREARPEEVDGSDDNTLDSDCDDNQAEEIPDFFHKASCNVDHLQFGNFKDEIVLANSQQHKNCARSEDSWSEIELSEPDNMSQASWEDEEESEFLAS